MSLDLRKVQSYLDRTGLDVFNNPVSKLIIEQRRVPRLTGRARTAGFDDWTLLAAWHAWHNERSAEQDWDACLRHEAVWNFRGFNAWLTMRFGS